MEYNLHEPELE